MISPRQPRGKHNTIVQVDFAKPQVPAANFDLSMAIFGQDGNCRETFCKWDLA